jgi:prepilin-type N-terminal cleavage/methylation domain-containing protein
MRVGRGGYTLVEIIVVLGIIGILSTLAYNGLASGNIREATRSVALEIRNAIRSSQEQALASKLNTAGQPADHYGVLLERDNSGKITAYDIIRIEKCKNLVTDPPTIIITTTLPKGVTVTTSPSTLKAITFRKNKGDTQFFDSAGNPLAPDADGSATITATGVGTYQVKIFKDTGRIE